MSTFLDLLRCILCRGEEDPRPYRQDDLDVTSLIRNRFQDPTTTTTTTTTDYTQISSYDPHPRTISPANSTSFINQLNAQTTARIQSPFSSVASNFPNTSATPSAVAKHRIETPKRHPLPQVSVANSTTTPSAVAKPKTETLKPPPPPPRPDLSLASSSSSSSFGTPQLSIKPILSQAPLNPTIPQTKSNYILVEKANFPNTSTTPSAVAKPRIETPKTHPQPQVSVANSKTTPSAVAKPKSETPKRTPHQVLDAYSTTDQKLTHKSSPKPPPPRPDLSFASSSSSSSSSSGTPQLSTKSILSQAQLNPTIPQTKSNYVWVEKANFPNTSITPCAVAKPRIETPKTHPQPQVSVNNSKTPSVAKPKTETPKSSPNPPPSRPDSSLASSSSSFGTPQLYIKPILSQAPLNPTLPQTKSNYVWVEKGATPLYMIPKDIKGLIQKDIVPDVLKKPLSPSTYIDYFDALLYAENYYLEKWDGFEMKDVSLQLHKAAIYGWKSKNKHLNRSDEKDDKIFVAFETDFVPERRPFLLSRDFASVRPSGRKVEPFQGIIYRVLKNSNLVLVEFGEDFHSQHHSSCKYDVKFSFNRVCLKRAHQAIAAVSDVLLRKFLFPEQLPKIYPIQTQVFVNHKLDTEQANAVRYIIRLQDPPPYLVEGPLSVTNTKERPQYANNSKELSRTGVVVREAVLHICQTTPSSRILICAPLNSTCDMLMRSLQNEIPESDMFRANAAFREVDGVPIDILPSCLYKGECFSCPSLKELKKYKVILSTFMSSFRLRDEGIVAGHFSHIFLVDASCATEPETLVPLANLANERTAVVITGAPNSCSGWIRSNIARQNGLMRSYFERLRESKAYKSLDPNYITRLKDA